MTLNELPRHDQLADEVDQLDWDINVHGRMIDFKDDPEPETVTV